MQHDRRAAEIPKALAVVERELRHLESWARRQALRPFVADLRRKLEAIRRAELERACSRSWPCRAGGDVGAARSPEPAAAGSGAGHSARRARVRPCRARRRPGAASCAASSRSTPRATRDRDPHRHARQRPGARGRPATSRRGCRRSAPGAAGRAGRDRLDRRPGHRRAAGRGGGHRLLHRDARTRAARRRASTSRCTATRTCRSRHAGPRRGRRARARAGRRRAVRPRRPDAGHAAGGRPRRHVQHPPHRTGAGPPSRPRRPARCAATSRRASAGSTSGEFDAIVLARAGLRAARPRRARHRGVPRRPMFLPAPAQGALAVQCRADDAVLIVALLAALDDAHDAPRRHGRARACCTPSAAAARCRSAPLATCDGDDASRSRRRSSRSTARRAVRAEGRGDDAGRARLERRPAAARTRRRRRCWPRSRRPARLDAASPSGAAP